MKNKIRFVGLVFILISVVSISLTLIIKQRNTYDAVAFSGIVQAGGYNETSYHTMIFAKSRLYGNLTVEGGDLYFQIRGYNADENRYMKDRFLVNDSTYRLSFSANDLYNFVFNNTHSDKNKVVIFNLKEEAIETPHPLFRFGVISFFFILPGGLVFVIVDYVYEKWRRRLEEREEKDQQRE